MHDALQGFREGRGTGAVMMDTNMDKQLTGLEHKTLFQIFLYVRKAYDFLDKEQ